MGEEIKDLKSGDAVLAFYLIKAVSVKLSSSNKKYLDLTLADKTGEINAKLWDCGEEDVNIFQDNVFVKIKGTVGEWQSRLQLRIEKIRLVTEEDGVRMEDYVPSAPEMPEKMYQELIAYLEKIKDRDIHKIVACLVEEVKEELYFYPAAKQNHHAVRGGLLYHITTMLQVGEKLCDIYPVNRDLLMGGIILHDLAKIEEMNAGAIGLISDYSVEGQLLGHIIQGIKKIDQAARKTGADPEVSLLLQHMVLSHHDEPEYGSPKRPMFPEAELLHHIDMIDARMFDMLNTLEKTEDGAFSGKIWTLDGRRLYQSGYGKKTESE